MAFQSMTGYGFGTAMQSGMTVNAELSSVNRKQLDIHLRLPRDAQMIETKVSEMIQKNLARGRIHGEITIEYSGTAKKTAVTVNTKLAKEYLKQIRQTSKELGLKEDLDASLLLKLPEVVHVEESPLDADKLWRVASKALKGALDELMKMRLQEGRELLKDLEGRVALLDRGLTKIIKRAPQIAVKYRKDLIRRIELSGIDVPDDDNRLLKEVVLFADRSDITEETTRLASHLKQTATFFKSKKPVGRSLDFLAQEMFREINTIGSKGNDTAIAREVVAFKSELERFREQVQNIE